MTKLNVFCIESSGGTAYKVFVFSSHNTVQKFITNKTKNLTVHVGWLTWWLVFKDYSLSSLQANKGLNALEQTVTSVLVSSYLIRDPAMVVVPHADPDWTLDFIRGRPRCVVTFPI